jgi:DNA-binding response OmpR family regulator
MRLLVVEDELKMRELLADALGRGENLVTVARTGVEGLELASALNFDAIVLDRMLPEMDGTEVARRLRRGACKTPILMLTARDAVGDVVTGLDAGVDDYLTKPFAIAELQARLRALQRRQPAFQSDVLRFGGLELSSTDRQVRRNGVEVRLTRTEFRILELLIKQPNKVHRREALIQAIWGDHCSVEENTLDVFIKQLRAKLEADDPARIVHTVRSIGYRLAEAT